MTNYPDTAPPTVLHTGPDAIDIAWLVQRFLSWELPTDVCTDPNTHRPGGNTELRFGTNLLSHAQARAMLQHVLAGLELPAPRNTLDAAQIGLLRLILQMRLTDDDIDKLCAPGRAARWNNDGRQYDRDTARLVEQALLQRLATAESTAFTEGWRALVYAPLDGTEIELLIRHRTWWTARKCGESGDKWQGPCRGKWLDFNGGGWSWQGHAGQPVGWRPLSARKEG